MKQYSVLTLAALLASQNALGLDLIESYEKAIAYDSGIASARATLDATREAEGVTRSPLLPQVNAFGGATHEDSDEPTSNDSYKVFNYGIELTQPLFRAEEWFRYDVSQLETEAARADYNLAQQQLILDVATAYFNVLRARDFLSTARATEAAIRRQYEQAQERFDVGLIAITAVYEARASFDDSKSQRIAAENDLNVAKERLARLTGEYANDIENLRQAFPLPRPTPMDPSSWESTALQQNWLIKSSTYNLDAAETQLKVAKAGHYPTVDLTASHANSELRGLGGFSGVQTQTGGTTTTNTLSIQLNVPLYSGGGTQAGVRQQRALVRVSEEQLKTTRRDVRVNTRSLFLTVNNNVETTSALKQTIISRRSALDATRAGYEVGTRNIVEVLDAERAYYVALRDYANARYDYVVNSLQLKQSAGTLSPRDLIELNNWLSAAAPGIEALANEKETLDDPTQ
jgi:outer membrane protein